MLPHLLFLTEFVSGVTSNFLSIDPFFMEFLPNLEIGKLIFKSYFLPKFLLGQRLNVLENLFDFLKVIE